jgi:DNA-binding LacI/PurR family transcriptional regulator
MNKAQVTIKDIARELGISPSTVSKALSGNPDISEATRKAVRALVDKWNYKPDPIALSLQGGRSRTIGVIIPEIVHYFFSTVVSGIEDTAYDSGYLVLFCQSNETYEREVKAVKTLIASRADGIMAAVSKTTTVFDHFSAIIGNGVPLVFFDRNCEELATDSVTVDDEAGAYGAVMHLIETGCRNIVHLAGPQNLLIGRSRKNGYIRALRESGLPLLEENIIRCDTDYDVAMTVPGLLHKNPGIDGIFAVNDNVAAQSMRIVKAKGLRIPEDISFIGFTCGVISELTDPPLTSVKQDGYEIGREAIRLMIRKIEARNGEPAESRVIKTELVIKGSTRKI